MDDNTKDVASKEQAKPSPYPPWQAERGISTGRPTLYNPEYCDIVVAMGSSEGKSSLAQVAARFDTSKPAIQNWIRDYPEFAAAMQRASASAEAYWEETYRQKALHEGKSMAQAYVIFDMKNRFGWQDTRDVSFSGTVEHKLTPAKAAWKRHARQIKSDEQEAIEAEYRDLGPVEDSKT